MAEEFECARCHRTFRKGWTDSEAHAEAEETFGYRVPDSQVKQLCDDCYGEFQEWLKTLSPERRAALDRETLSA